MANRNIFIKEIEIKEVRNIKPFTIPLSETERKHLIITGKNGSGKTTLLNEIKYFINISLQPKSHNPIYSIIKLNNIDESNIEKRNEYVNNNIKDFYYSDLIISRYFKKIAVFYNNYVLATDAAVSGNFVLAYFAAKRNATLLTPKGINRVELKPVYSIEENIGKDFIQYIVNLKADTSFAKDDNDIETANKIDTWFKDFEENLNQLFDNGNAKLEFDRKNYNFLIKEEGKEAYNLNQLSDGYSAILDIVTELIMRMEENKTKSYDVEGVVLIDEVETHLHVDLQKKVLPFLTSFFPKIQFIVTTHSPFVISSISNAVICDLEKQIVTTDLSGYSYDTIIESYFDADKYSTELKDKIDLYETLLSKEELSDGEKDALTELKMYLNEIPKFISDELAVKLQQIKLKHIKRRANDLHS